MPEDTVTGSNHASLIPFWANKPGKKHFHARQLSARVGDLYCELVGDRVLIAGMAVPFLEGEINIEL